MESYTEEGLQLYQVLMQLDAERQKAFLETKTSGVRLSGRQSMALLCIKQLTAQQMGGVSLKLLSQHLGMAISATSVMVETMVQKNLLQRSQAPRDRRAVRISMTPGGEKLFLLCNAALLARMSKLAELLTETERAVLRNLAAKISSRNIS